MMTKWPSERKKNEVRKVFFIDSSQTFVYCLPSGLSRKRCTKACLPSILRIHRLAQSDVRNPSIVAVHKKNEKNWLEIILSPKVMRPGRVGEANRQNQRQTDVKVRKFEFEWNFWLLVNNFLDSCRIAKKGEMKERWRNNPNHVTKTFHVKNLTNVKKLFKVNLEKEKSFSSWKWKSFWFKCLLLSWSGVSRISSGSKCRDRWFPRTSFFYQTQNSEQTQKSSKA